MTNFSNIWTQSNCLSKSQLIGYIQQTLDRDEIYLVESHLNDCQICSDALDGLMEEDLEITQQHISAIKSTVEERIIALHTNEKSTFTSNQTTKKTSTNSGSTLSVTSGKYRWLVAASVLAFIALGGYSVYSFIRSQDQTLAQNKTSGDTKDAEYNKPALENDHEITTLKVNPPDENSAPPTDLKDEKKERKEDMATSTKPSSQTNEFKAVPAPPVQVQKTPVVGKDAPKQVEREAIAQTENESAKDLEKNIEPSQGMSNYEDDKKVYKPQQEEVVAKTKSKVGMSNSKQMPAAQNAKELSYPQQNDNNYYSNQNANQANNEVYARKKTETKTELSDYEKAMQAYNSGDYKESIRFFERALKSASGTQKEDIQYQLAQAYLKTGKENKAEKLFEILATGTKYKNEASQQLLKAKK